MRSLYIDLLGGTGDGDRGIVAILVRETKGEGGGGGGGGGRETERRSGKHNVSGWVSADGHEQLKWNT